MGREQLDNKLLQFSRKIDKGLSDTWHGELGTAEKDVCKILI